MLSSARSVDQQKSRKSRHTKPRRGSVVDWINGLSDNNTKDKEWERQDVKVIMEEAVTKRQIDLDSPYVTSLCVAVENCLMDGLRRRLLGLFGNRSSLALLHTIAKINVVAEQVLAKTLETNSE
ncbi:hypothetical protein NECAME_03488 [Necator americanus]|uniref:RUN domain-containing protein n=1 Tax=Necator americanus TaxID=51031 RepID=W2T2V0_NECAM|nr:hypothetical protein NECAME_03488 [Necator americanus]ETN76325.1 hypothetical protein NECAME_03488 [Necator americanus]